jgi:hypothetical protein
MDGDKLANESSGMRRGDEAVSGTVGKNPLWNFILCIFH